MLIFWCLAKSLLSVLMASDLFDLSVFCKCAFLHSLMGTVVPLSSVSFNYLTQLAMNLGMINVTDHLGTKVTRQQEMKPYHHSHLTVEMLFGITA